MSDGYILLYRKAENNPALQDDRPFDKFHAWVWMIQRANYKPIVLKIDGQFKKLKRGQFHTSERHLAKKFKWSREKVRRFLRDLEVEKMITTDSTTNGTTITIEKYSIYQGGRTTNKTTNETSQTTNETTSSIGISTTTGDGHTTNEAQRNNNKEGHGQHRSDDRASVPNNDPRYMEIAMGEPDEFIIDRDI